MTDLTFEPWPKIARLNRDCIITEKIDGTNAAVIVVEASPSDRHGHPHGTTLVDTEDYLYLVAAQSRTRLITPDADNFGFARWVHDNAEALAATLGTGRHFGEWWGQGIQRKYGLDHKRFSLFNVNRYGALDLSALPNVALVPTLYAGPFSTETVDSVVDGLRFTGSKAAPGFPRPEGVVVFHVAAQTVFKVTCEGDEAPKGMSA
jgi:hypothetical protein